MADRVRWQHLMLRQAQHEAFTKTPNYLVLSLTKDEM
jgi:hypothetical protein